MSDKLLEIAVNAFVKELFSEGKSILNELMAEGKQLLGITLEDYLRRQIKRYAHIKTLLRGNTPAFIYDVYYHLNIYNHEYTAETRHIKNIFARSNCITIIGDAGSGKSTLVKHLFLNSINEKYAIPILVELRYLNTTDDALIDYINDKILENKISQNDKILERMLEKGSFVFFLDGFDELNSERKQSVVEDIVNFTNKYLRNKFVLTTRPYSDIENLTVFHNYRMSPLRKVNGDIDSFIDLQLKDEMELADRIKNSLKENKSQYIESFLKNPLLLSLYILTFQSNASIPDKKYIFYRRVINALFAEHDSKTKLGFVRQKKSGLSQEYFEEILKAFCYLSYFDGKFVFDYDYIECKLKEIKNRLPFIIYDINNFIYDLKSAIALLVEDNGDYSFAHRSLQEYFAALFVKNINEANKERLYTKIVDKLTTNVNLNETENFLSLCHEMDTLNYLRYYYLPLLYELRETIDDTNDDTMFDSVILFLCEGVKVHNNNKDNIEFRTSININVYRTIYVHYKYTKKINDALHQIINANKMVFKAYNMKIIRFDKVIPPDIRWVIKTSRISNLIIGYKNFIEDSISKTSTYISECIDNAKEFVEMI